MKRRSASVVAALACVWMIAGPPASSASNGPPYHSAGTSSDRHCTATNAGVAVPTASCSANVRASTKTGKIAMDLSVAPGTGPGWGWVSGRAFIVARTYVERAQQDLIMVRVRVGPLRIRDDLVHNWNAYADIFATAKHLSCADCRAYTKGWDPPDSQWHRDTAAHDIALEFTVRNAKDPDAGVPEGPVDVNVTVFGRASVAGPGFCCPFPGFVLPGVGPAEVHARFALLSVTPS